jgi:glycosyltransferase involved in cell wall biosynthesis
MKSMSEAAPDISVIMPMRNMQAYVEQAVRSVLAQQGVRLELIVVDDGSTDGSAAVVRAIDDPRVILTPGPQQGIAAALNAGLAIAKGAYFARCDSDDWYEADRLAGQLEFLRTRHEFGAVCGSYVHVTPSGNVIAHQQWSTSAEEITGELRDGIGRTHLCTFLVRMEILRTLGGFRPFFIGTEDNDFQLRLGDIQRVWYEPSIAYRYRLHGESITHTQPSGQRSWLEAKAREFQLQRQSTGKDDLERGHPPTMPTSFEQVAIDPKLQMRDLLLGDAWKLHGQGKKPAAVLKGIRAIGVNPRSWASWKSVAALMVKPCRSR